MEETQPEVSFSQLVHDHLSLHLKEFERYFLITKDAQADKELICDPFVNKLGEYSMSVQEELFEITNDGGLRSMFETSISTILDGYSWQNTPRLPQQH